MQMVRRTAQDVTAPVEPDDAPPSPDRQTELTSRVTANEVAGRSPCAGVRVNTRGELQWLLRIRVGDDAVDPGTEKSSAGEVNDEIDLRGAVLRGAVVSGVQLAYADLSGADLSSANLRGANLRGANLSGTNLYRADLRSTDISDCEMSSRTNMKNVRLDGETLLGDVKWNDVSVTRVDFSKLPRLGDESDIYRKQSRTEYISACRYAARAYRDLSILLRSQGVVTVASRYRLRQQQLERYAALAEGRVGSWLGSLILDRVAGYGERPGRIFVTYVLVVSLFAVAYWWLTNITAPGSSQLLWYEAVVLSLSSFHGRGFFPTTISLGDPIAVVAAIEAVIGLFIELILIATFSRRFLGN